MALHHIIPRHEWRDRFGNLRGFNNPDNLVDLTTEQHAQVHLHYFNEITHIEYDRIAYSCITGQIGREEANRQAVIVSNTGKIHSREFCEERRQRMTGKLLPESWRKNISLGQLGSKRGPHTLEHSLAQSKGQMGRKDTEKSKKNKSLAASKRWSTVRVE